MAGMPRIVLLNRFYWPDVAATAQMLTDLAEDMAARGWQVTIVTSRSQYEGGDAPLPAREHRHEVEVRRVGSTRFGRQRILGRIADSGSYLLGAAVALARLPRQDVVVAMTDPPLLLSVAWALGRIRGWRVVLWAQDLFPELAVRLGVLAPEGAAHRIARRVARQLHGRADLVIALGPAMAEAIQRAGARPERVVIAPNWADARAIRSGHSGSSRFLRENDLEGRFLVMYSGNAGRAHAFGGVIGAMHQLRDRPDVVFVFIGGGARLPELRAAAARLALGNVRFLDYQPREALGESLSAAGLSLVTEDPRAAGLLVPSKTYGILASGRPLAFLGSAESDVARIVNETGCGWVLDPEDAAGLATLVRRLAEDPALAARAGARGRRALEEAYDRPIATARWMSAVHLMLTTPEVTA